MTLDARITFARASVGTYYDSAGVLRTAVSGAARFDYDPVTHVAKGILIEEAATNLATWSEDFSNAVWTKTGLTVTANQIASPDGTTNADLLTASASPATIGNAATIVSTAQNYWQSVYVKKGTSDWVYMLGQPVDSPRVWFNVNTGTVGTIGTGITSAAIQNVGNGWYRCSFNDIGASGAETLTVGLSDADNSTTVTVGRTAYVWGAQGEATGTVLTSYIPTTSAGVTRAADVATMTGTNFSSWYNTATGTFVAEFDYRRGISGTIEQMVFSAEGAAGHNITFYRTVADAARADAVAGTNQFVTSLGAISANVTNKLGLSFAAGDYDACLNGGTVVSSSGASVPTLTLMRIGHNTAGINEFLNGHVRRIRFFNVKKTNAELQALTT